MGIVSWLIFGFLAGLVAHLIVPVKKGGGCGGIVLTAAIGMVGAVVGGFIGSALDLGRPSGFDLRSFVLAVIGAVLVLAVFRAISND